MPFIYSLGAADDELELAQAELWALTGTEARGRLAVAPVACDIGRSAYVAFCGELVASGPSLGELCAQVAHADPASDGFRIAVQYLQPRPQEATPEITTRLADALAGNPDLRKPRVRFHVQCREGHWQFLRVVSASSRGYLRHTDRPRQYSNSLPTRQARAFVNLAAAPGDRLLDPCCGMGTCLIEACDMGIRATGVDLNSACVWAAKTNLAHFGLCAAVSCADARTLTGAFDAVVLDLPYGHSSHVPEGLYEGVLASVAALAPRLAVVVAHAADDLFASVGLQVLRFARVRKGSLVRHYYVLHSPAA